MNLTRINQLCADASVKNAAVKKDALQLALDLELEITTIELSTLLQKYSSKEKTAQNSSRLSDELITDLTEFLQNRDARVTINGLGYTAQPKSPANQLCKKIAEDILSIEGTSSINYNYALYRLLMPSLKITGIVELVKDARLDTDDLPPYGTFLLSQALISGKPGPLIDFHDLICLSNNLYLYAHLFQSVQKADLLSNKVRNRHLLKTIKVVDHALLNQDEKNRVLEFNQTGRDFLLKKEQEFKREVEGGTPRDHISALAKGLTRGGEGHGEGGEEYEAGVPAKEAIGIFFVYFNTLPPHLKLELRSLKGINYTSTFGNILDILREPPSVESSTISCVNINSIVMNNILDNPANAAVLNSEIRSRMVKSQIKIPMTSSEHISNRLDPHFYPNISQRQGRDTLKLPEYILTRMCEHANNWDICTEIIELFENKQHPLIRKLYVKFINYYQNELTPQKNMSLCVYFALLDVYHRVEVYKLIRNTLSAYWLPKDLAIFITLLPIEQTADFCNKLESTTGGDIEQFDLLITGVPQEKADIICKTFKVFWYFVIKTKDDLKYLLNTRTTSQCESIIHSLNEGPILNNLIINVGDFVEVLKDISSEKISVIYQVFILHLKKMNGIQDRSDIKQILELPGLTHNQGIWICLQIKNILYTLISDHIQFSLNLSYFSIRVQEMIVEALQDDLYSIIHSLESFNNVFTFLSKLQRVIVFNNLGASYVVKMINTPDDFNNVLSLLDNEQSRSVYFEIHDRLPTFISTSSDLHQILSNLPNDLSSHFFVHFKDLFIKYFNVSLLKLLSDTQVSDLYMTLGGAKWLATQNMRSSVLKSFLEYCSDPIRVSIFEQIEDTQLIHMTATSQDFYNINIFLPLDLRVSMYQRNRFKLSEIITTPEDFTRVLSIIPLSQLDDFWYITGENFLNIFQTVESLNQLNPSLSKILPRLDNMILNRFIPIYRSLREAESGFVKSNFIKEKDFVSATGFNKIKCVWKQVEMDPYGRVAKTLYLALQPFNNHELQKKIREIVQPRSQSTLLTYYRRDIYKSKTLADPNHAGPSNRTNLLTMPLLDA